jgi:hypothetical protein
MARRSPVTHDRRKTFSAVTSRKYCKKSNGPLPNNSFDVASASFICQSIKQKIFSCIKMFLFPSVFQIKNMPN